MNKRLKFVLLSTVYAIVNISMYFVNYHFKFESGLLILLSVLATIVGVIVALCITYESIFDVYTINPKSVIVSFYMKNKGDIAIDVDGEFFVVGKKSKLFYQVSHDTKDDIQIIVKKNFWGVTMSRELFMEGRLQDYKIPE